MFEAADEVLPVIEDSSVNQNGGHVLELEKMADEAGVDKSTVLSELNQSNEEYCTWEDDLKQNDIKDGG